MKKEERSNVTLVLLMVILLSAVSEDFRTFRISNKLIQSGAFCCLLAGLLVRVSAGEGPGSLFLYLASRILGAVLLLFLLMPLWRIRLMGGGDVKLLLVCELSVGFGGSINILIYALFCGGAAAILFLAGSAFFPKITQTRRMENGLHRIHFSLPILLGFCLRLIWKDLLVLPFFQAAH